MIGKNIDPRELRTRVREILEAEEFEEGLKKLFEMPRRKALNALSFHLVSHEEEIRWRAVTAFGKLAADLAHQDLEAGRVILQRQMWNLNEESGNYALSAAEVMAEIMINHDKLAREFAHVLVSFVTPEGLYLDDLRLRCGAVWGIGRLAQKKPELFNGAPPRLVPFLDSRDAQLRGLAAWALGAIGAKHTIESLNELLDDDAEIRLYLDRKLMVRKISEIAREALTLSGEKHDG